MLLHADGLAHEGHRLLRLGTGSPSTLLESVLNEVRALSQFLSALPERREEGVDLFQKSDFRFAIAHAARPIASGQSSLLIIAGEQAVKGEYVACIGVLRVGDRAAIGDNAHDRFLERFALGENIEGGAFRLAR